MRFSILLSLLLLFSSLSYSQSLNIIYASDNNESGFFQIYTMDDFGNNVKQMTDMPYHCQMPHWSQDGKKIVFNTDEPCIYLIEDADTDTPSNPIYLHFGYNAVFTPEGNEIIFNSEYEGFQGTYVMSLEDYEVYPLSSEVYSNQQVLSDDGTKLVYSAIYKGTKCIMLTDLNDTTDNDTYKISINSDSNLEPDISSDNNMIVYASFNLHLKGTIYLYKYGTEKALTKGISSSNQPRFSYDDDKIAFVVIEEKSVNLWVTDIDGGNRKEIKTKGGSLRTFKWIDNDWILYDAGEGNSINIYLVNTVTGENVALTNKGNNIHPDFLYTEQ